jgi:hypothetical protein
MSCRELTVGQKILKEFIACSMMTKRLCLDSGTIPSKYGIGTHCSVLRYIYKLLLMYPEFGTLCDKIQYHVFFVVCSLDFHYKI